jgi:hypothetical protein
LRAGLIPRLRRKSDWVVISRFEVAREPVRNLLDRVGEALAGLGIPAQGLDLTKTPDDPAALAQILDETLRLLEQQATGAWVLLPLDQAEVLVTGDRPPPSTCQVGQRDPGDRDWGLRFIANPCCRFRPRPGTFGSWRLCAPRQ